MLEVTGHGNQDKGRKLEISVIYSQTLDHIRDTARGFYKTDKESYDR